MNDFILFLIKLLNFSETCLNWNLNSKTTCLNWTLNSMTTYLNWNLNSKITCLNWNLNSKTTCLNWNLTSKTICLNWNLNSKTICLNWNLNSKTCLNQTLYKVPLQQFKWNFNLGKPNTSLIWTHFKDQKVPVYTDYTVLWKTLVLCMDYEIPWKHFLVEFHLLWFLWSI